MRDIDAAMDVYKRVGACSMWFGAAGVVVVVVVIVVMAGAVEFFFFLVFMILLCSRDILPLTPEELSA